jgi:hypothetical protein
MAEMSGGVAGEAAVAPARGARFGRIRRRTVGRLCVAASIVIAGAIVIYLATRQSGQAQVGADLLPVVATAHETATYVDCSKVGPVSYDEHRPCQTFALIRSSHFGSAQAFLDTESALLQKAGWRHPAAPLLVDSDAGGHTASISESWAAPNHEGCAFLTTVAAGVRAEAKEIFPYDQYNTPRGVLVFYRIAKASRANQTLWARLQPGYINGEPAC